MKRTYIAILSSTVLAAFMAAGGTLAYFTSNDSVINEAQAGSIDIDIVEEYNPPELIFPGDTVEKAVNIQNNGDDAFIRVSISKYWTNDGEISDINSDNIEFTILNGWQEIDGFYYAFVKGGELSPTLMSEFTFANGENDNDYKSLNINININADAIQVRNNAMESEWGVTYNADTGLFSLV